MSNQLNIIRGKIINKINSLISYSCSCQCCLQYNSYDIDRCRQKYSKVINNIIEGDTLLLVKKKELNILLDSMDENINDIKNILIKSKIKCNT